MSFFCKHNFKLFLLDTQIENKYTNLIFTTTPNKHEWCFFKKKKSKCIHSCVCNSFKSTGLPITSNVSLRSDCILEQS